MKTFFVIKTAAYHGPEIGPKDTVSVEIQRYDALGVIVSREKLDAIIVKIQRYDALGVIVSREKLDAIIVETEIPGDRMLADFDEYLSDEPSDAEVLVNDVRKDVEES